MKQQLFDLNGSRHQGFQPLPKTKLWNINYYEQEIIERGAGEKPKEAEFMMVHRRNTKSTIPAIVSTAVYLVVWGHLSTMRVAVTDRVAVLGVLVKMQDPGYKNIRQLLETVECKAPRSTRNDSSLVAMDGYKFTDPIREHIEIRYNGSHLLVGTLKRYRKKVSLFCI